MEKDKLKKGFGKFLQFFVPVVIGVGLFYFLCKNVDIDQMKEIMRSEINYWWIGAALIISVLRLIISVFIANFVSVKTSVNE